MPDVTTGLRRRRSAIGRRGRRAPGGRRVLARLVGGALLVGTLTVPASSGVAAAESGVHDTLGSAASARGLSFGAAVSANHLSEAAYVSTLDTEFTSVTPENEMMLDAVEPRQGSFVFTAADRIVDHATSRGMKVRGHALIWHTGLPGWVAQLSSAGLRAAMSNHVTAVASHFKGKIYAWDVVNEAFMDDGKGSRRPSFFQNVVGNDYLELAFKAARAADPGARLCYNDYNIEGVNAKSNAVYILVKDFKARGVPIDCVGFESHFSKTSPVPADYQENLQRFAALGVDVQITELDVEGSGAAQANDYSRVVTTCLAVSRCTGITVWGVSDRYSWRSINTPLLFDVNYNKKSAYSAVLAALGVCSVREESACHS